MTTHTERIANDATYARLAAEYDRLGSEVDAATDGALHHAYPADVADRMVWAINRQYASAANAFHSYREGMNR